MRLVQQPPNSTTCGHAVVAMLANKTYASVCNALGHTKPTTWREMYTMLFTFGVVCDAGMVPVFGVADIPPVGVLLFPSGVLGHLAVCYGGYVYDPAYDEVYDTEALPFRKYPANSVLFCSRVYNVPVTR